MAECRLLSISRERQVTHPESSIRQRKDLRQRHRFRCEFTFPLLLWPGMPCSKEEYIETNSKESCEELYDQVMKGELFRFLQVDIHVPDELIDKFSKFCLLFVIDTIPEELIPRHMKEYQERNV